MKKYILLLSFLWLQWAPICLLAQQNSGRIESIKIAYLTEKLNLDPKTAERFWPIYNQYDDEMRQVLSERKKTNDTRSAEEILDQEQKAIDIKRKYSILFQKVVNKEQLNQLFQSEKEFNLMLIKRRNKMENRAERRSENTNLPSFDRPRMNPQRNPEQPMGNRNDKPKQKEPSSDNAQPRSRNR